MAADGEIIYHPKQNLIHVGLYEENNTEAAGYEDTTVKENFHGEKRLVTVKTISYTGWKLISVVPMKSFTSSLCLEAPATSLSCTSLLLHYLYNRQFTNKQNKGLQYRIFSGATTP